MPSDPTERDVNLLLFQTGIRTVKKIVLALTIHDQKITMTKPARARCTVRTGLALPFEGRTGTNAHRTMSFASPHYRHATPNASSFPEKVEVRGSRHISLSTPWPHQECDSPPEVQQSKDQHRSPVCGPTAVPCPNEYEQRHEESGKLPTMLSGDDPFYDPVSSCRQSDENTPSPCKKFQEQPYSQTFQFYTKVSTLPNSELPHQVQVTRQQSPGDGR